MRPLGFWGLLTWAVLMGALGVSTLVDHYSPPRDAPIPTATPITVTVSGGDPFVTARHAIGPLDPSGDPVAHRPNHVGLVGAVYPNYSEQLQPMALLGVPFTFVVPETWACEPSVVTPTHAVQHCADRLPGPAPPELNLEVDRCPVSCTDADRATVVARLHHPVQNFPADEGATSFGTETVNGRYYLRMVDEFTVSPDEPLGWIVVAQADSVPADTAVVQRIVNDIYAQTRV
jgi:hypothetical protein